MAGLMTAPMVLAELAVMGSMYPNRRRNVLIAAVSVGCLALLWVLIRQQTAITDRQFLQSMIPHHASAVLMCRKAPIRDAEVQRLCQEIVASQEGEIRQMKQMLREKKG